MDDIKHLHAINDSRNLYKNIKNLMGKPNYNKGTFLLHNNQEIHDQQEQANIFADTWANIMTPNTPKNTIEIQEHVQRINNWCIQNEENINPHNVINLNNLNKQHILSKPITVTESGSFLKKSKAKPPALHKSLKKFLATLHYKQVFT